MGSLVLAGATSGSTTITPTDAVTATLTLPSTTGTLLTSSGAISNLAGGSNGTIPYQSASGTTQMLAVGTSGQVLQTNGVGAPTWATASAGGFSAMTVITSSGTFTIPSGKTTIKVTVVGGGGGGAGCSTTTVTAGTAGGFSRIASGTQTISSISGNGGGGAPDDTNPTVGGTGGTSTGGDLNFSGSSGGVGPLSGQVAMPSGFGGASFFGGGASGTMGTGANSPGLTGLSYGGGGSGANRYGNQIIGGGGGGGGTAIKYLTSLTAGNTLTITIGSGGAGGANTYVGGTGASGVVVIEY
jgi:hypothetical protein